MAGNPTFQGSAFQASAFQSGAMLVASSYSLGSPAFATPALHGANAIVIPAYTLQPPVFARPSASLTSININPYTIAPLGWPLVPPSLHFNYHFNVPANAYWLQSPIFIRPQLLASGQLKQFTAYPYSLASPAFALPAAKQTQIVHVNAYALGGLAFGAAHIGQTFHLFANRWAVGSPVFAAPYVTNNYKFTAAAYSVGPLYFLPPNAPIRVNYTLFANAYWLQNPWPNHPRLSIEIVDLGLPPLYYTQAEEAASVLTNLLNLILQSIPSQQTEAGDQLRRLVSILRANAEAAVRGNTLGTDLQAIYLAADAAGAMFLGMDKARKYLMSQVASRSALTQAVFRSALVMTLAEQAKIISRMRFKTQMEIVNLMFYMRDAFDAAKAMGIGEIDVLVYQTLNAMGGALMNHLGTTELQLPRYVSYSAGAPMPSLYLAQRIYADPRRSDEIEAENDVIHPAFCPINLRVLSNAVIGTTQYGI